MDQLHGIGSRPCRTWSDPVVRKSASKTDLGTGDRPRDLNPAGSGRMRFAEFAFDVDASLGLTPVTPNAQFYISISPRY
jgi:hypothetical protein